MFIEIANGANLDFRDTKTFSIVRASLTNQHTCIIMYIMRASTTKPILSAIIVVGASVMRFVGCGPTL